MGQFDTALLSPIVINHDNQYEVPVDPMDDLQCESCQ
jgi:hypothetical protein